MNILVTGGAGFVGSHLVDALINQGENVAIVDNLASGLKTHINSKARYYEISVSDPALSEVIQTEKPRLVYHLAAQTSVGRSVTDPSLDGQVNILGSLNVISNCIQAGVRKLVYSSSSAIYGHPTCVPVKEEHPAHPLSPYGVSKYAVEHYLAVFNRLFGLSYTTLRFANVYGPRQNPFGEGGVVAIFADKMLTGKRPVIFGDGTKTRDYVYVSDVVSAILAAGNYAASDTFNVGTGIETCDDAVFELLSQACGYLGGHDYVPDRPGDIRHLYLDCTKANRLLNWIPQVKLNQGIAQTVAYYREINQIRGGYS